MLDLCNCSKLKNKLKISCVYLIKLTGRLGEKKVKIEKCIRRGHRVVELVAVTCLCVCDKD